MSEKLYVSNNFSLNFDSKGNTKLAVDANSEIIGYTVSVYVPGKENQITPVRYNLTDSLNNIKTEELLQGNKSRSNQSDNAVSVK